MNTKKMTNKELRDYVANQCGYNPSTNKAQLAAETLGLSNKTQPQRLLESIIPAKQEIRTALKSYLNPEFNKKLDEHLATKTVQVCNAGDWPDHLPSSFSDWLKANGDSIDITMPLDRTEATCVWFDNKAKNELPF